MEIEQIKRFIEEKKLFRRNDRVLVAVSGGADSVALLRLLLEMDVTCEAAHCNFHLRDAESDRDEMFVRALCQQLQVKLHIAHFNTRAVAEQRHQSIEMAARELRYQWFEEVRQQCGAAVIAVAHHRDDDIETFLLNLIRGTGIQGLRGIRPRNGHVVRPLLGFSRQELTAYLERIGQSYVTDSTNLQDEYTRNKIRLRLLPLLEEINPSVRESIATTAHYLDEAARLYEQGIAEGRERVMKGTDIDLPRVMEEPSPESLLFECLRPYGFNSTQVADIMHHDTNRSGRQFLTAEWRAVRDRNTLHIEPRKQALTPPPLREERRTNTADFAIPHDKRSACFDADKLHGEWHLRLWQQGDWFVPFGMKGRKLVSDYLTDRKFSLSEKERQWVLCCGNDICWLIGERTDNRFRIDENTREIVLLTMTGD